MQKCQQKQAYHFYDGKGSHLICLSLYHHHFQQCLAHGRFPIDSCWSFSLKKQGQKYLGSVIYKNTLATRVECGAKIFVSWKMCYILRVKIRNTLRACGA